MKLLWLLPLLFLVGCGTTGKDTQVRTVFEIHNNSGVITISPGIDQESLMGDLHDVSTDNRPNVPIDLEIPIIKSDAAKILSDSIIKDTDAKIIEAAIPEEAAVDGYETRFHHTQTWTEGWSGDKGKSLVLCPDQDMGFTKCTANIVEIPLRDGLDEGRIIYWNQTKAAVGDIICTTSDGTEYKYPAKENFIKGSCD